MCSVENSTGSHKEKSLEHGMVQGMVQAGDQRESLKSDVAVQEADRGQYMGFIRVVGRRNS